MNLPLTPEPSAPSLRPSASPPKTSPRSFPAARRIPPQPVITFFTKARPATGSASSLEGEVEIVRGAAGRSVTLATLVPGAVFGEGVMLDDSPHSGSAEPLAVGARCGRSRGRLRQIRTAKNPKFLPHRRATWPRRLSARFRSAAEQLAGEKTPSVIATVRMDTIPSATVNYPIPPITAYRPREAWKTFRSPGSAVPFRALRPPFGFREEGRRSWPTLSSVSSDGERAKAIVGACEEISEGKAPRSVRRST